MRFDEDPLLMRSQLVRTGTSDSEIRTATRNGTMKRIRRGAFADSSALQALGPEDRHVLRTRAHANAAGGRLVVSHQSAALVHGIALWAPDLQRVHFTVGRSGGGRKTGGRHVHPAPLVDDDIVNIRGLSVTSPSRTVADLCRALPFEAAVCAADSALAKKLVSIESVTEALNRRGRRNIAKALRALHFSSEHSESVGESRCRVQLHHAGFDHPELQVDLYTKGGTFLARVDFLLAQYGVIIEFDGMVKYSKYLKPGQTPAAAVVAEKKREDALRAHGWIVLRLTWSDLGNPDRPVSKLRASIELAAALPTPRTVVRPSAR
nr:endonuclease domain-containing protein [Rhodococcus sp. 15-1154-1]